MLHPPLITSEQPKILSVLDDLFELFSQVEKHNHINKKLLFYLVALKRLKREDWLRLEKEVMAELQGLRSETESDKEEEEERLALKV